MSFFNKVRETFRDKTRDNICAGLQSLGIDAQMAERGRSEEKIGGKGSLGVIDIPEGTIRWVNVSRISAQGSRTWYSTEYGVPDSRLWKVISPKLEIKSARKKDSWLWKGKDAGLGLIHRLNSDTSIGYPLLLSKSPKITIRAYSDNSCWVISNDWVKSNEMCVPSEELWNCYKTIASHLLAEWPTGHTLKIVSPLSAEPPTGDKVYNVCPRCGSSNLNKAVGRMPKSQQEIEALGFKTEWDCLCFNCRYNWVEREK